MHGKGVYKLRYLYRESDLPIATDYYYEARHTTNDEFPYVPSHTHNYYELYMFISGSCTLSVEDNMFDVKAGDIVIIPPYTIHQLYQKEPKVLPYIRMYLYITEACLKTFQFNEHNILHTLELAKKNKRFHFKINNPEHYDLIKSCMRRIYENTNKSFFGKELLNRSLILQMMTLLTMNIVNELKPQGIIHSNPMIEKLIAYINSNYTDDISLDSLTDMFYINKSTLSKEFKDYTSHTIHNYLVMKRISVAKQEMAEGISPSQVYLVSGFKDYSTFYRTFQRTEGMSPKEYFNLVTGVADSGTL